MSVTQLHPANPAPTLHDTAPMQEAVESINRANGWFDTGRSIREGRALLHSEVAEALEAFRDHGLTDATDYEGHQVRMNHPSLRGRGSLPKPEGVGSELADVLVRLLDQTAREGYALVVAVTDFPDDAVTFGDCMDVLHDAIAETRAFTAVGEGQIGYGRVLGLLVHICDRFEVDLMAEYARKIAYNATRGNRHGGKRL